MDVQFITNVAVITPDPSVSRRLYVDALGLPLTAEGDGYLHSEDIDGSKSFGLVNSRGGRNTLSDLG
jgi:catechol 2,3-dioxygenase-like lactoylglutathione lyase family enzyme